ncbi:hypothetical protein D917_09511 [Trichinella nativa]|uniref:Uncharacterized protein n=1 Tax=Trichinella nativa TaxID=6335 RepID=A0A1Y3EGI2_9BILA|nr:hypothetical protein D917_09511 [Trichinella nativa]
MDTPIHPKMSIWISLTTPGLEVPADRKLSINDSGTMLIKIFNDSPWIRSMSGRLHCPTSSSSTITAHLMPFGLFSPSEPRSMLPSIPSGEDSISNQSGCCQATEPLVRHHHEDPLNVELIQLNHFFTPAPSLRTQFGRQQIMSFQS